MNRGIDESSGEYIGICEPDDFPSRKMFEAYYRTAVKHDCDLVKSNFYQHSDSGRDTKVKVFNAFPYNRVISAAQCLPLARTMPCIWSALYRRSMLVDNDIRFSETPGASFQDTGFVQKVWVCAERVVLLRKAFQYYRVDNQASSSKSSSKVFAICGEYESTFAFLERRGSEVLDVFAPTFNAMRCDGYAWNYNRIAAEYRDGFVERWSTELREQCAKGLVDFSLFNSKQMAAVQLVLDHPEQVSKMYKQDIAYL